jgi:F0F1-type ATP synthase assembly protein I
MNDKESTNKAKDRIDQIQQKIDDLKVQKDYKKSNVSSNLAFNIAVELVAGVFVGVFVGILLDNLFDSKPIMIIICLIVATVATFRTIYFKNIVNK